jgi:hypothetical protein
MLLKPLEEIGCKFSAALASLINGNWSLQRNADGKTIAGTFSPDSSVLVLCGILSASGTTIVFNVAVACKVCILGFFDPRFPCSSGAFPFLYIPLYL